MEFLINFDYGHDWRFLLLVESFTVDDSTLAEAKVIEQYGNPPEQYPDWDD
jgi:hypothetical protein